MLLISDSLSKSFPVRFILHAKTCINITQIIHAFITARLNYCNGLYFGVSQASLSRHQLVQNAATRLLTQSHRREHITAVLGARHWLPVCYRIDFKMILFVFKSDLLHQYSPSRSLRSADQLLLAVPKRRLTLRGDRAFASAAQKLWNELPLHVRQASLLSSFKSYLKTHLFSLAFNTA